MNDIDDEYRWAGTRDPKVVITTSRDPSSKLKMFAKVSDGLNNVIVLSEHTRDTCEVAGSQTDLPWLAEDQSRTL